MNRLLLVLITAAVLLTGCQTTSKIAAKIDLGMTKEQVLAAVGKPLKKAAFMDTNGDKIEVWKYQETTWDDAGFSWDRTIVRSQLTFKNNQLVAIGDLPDRYKNMNPMDPTVNVKQDITVREEKQK